MDGAGRDAPADAEGIPPDAQRILCCLRYGIGDVVMELPVLEALHRARPAARITLLGARPAVQLLDGDRRWQAIVTHQDLGVRHRWDRGEAGAAEAVAAWLEEEAPDLVLDAGHAPPAIAWQVWARELRGLQSDEEVESETLRAGGGGVDAVVAGVERGWGLHVPRPPRPRLRLDAERSWAGHLLERLVDGRAPVAFMPSASQRLKRWPEERFAAVADAVIAETGGPILLFDAPGDPSAERMAGHIEQPAAVRRVAPLHLRRTAALLERCRLFVSNDTGLMHVAAAVGTPVAAVFGPTFPGVYLPPGGEHRAAAAEIDCPHRHRHSLAPPDCWMHGHCLIGERSCIHGVAVEAVIDRVLTMLRPARLEQAG